MRSDTDGEGMAAVTAKLVAAGAPATIWVDLANAVMAAYTAYAKGTTPALTNYTYVASIYATESLIPTLLGFAACANDLSHNIIALRGTVTDEEVAYDLYGWDTNTPCLLPSASSVQQKYGNVKEDLYDFYTGTNGGTVTSLAASFNAAVQKLAQVNPNKPWFVTAHSLGGALATLGALDAAVSKSYGNGTIAPILVTFGSLHLGDQSFATAFKTRVPAGYRFANLSDFVPSLVSLEPYKSTDPYVHVGMECTFIWEKWDNWANHSMQFTYLPTVSHHFSVIQYGPRNYPQ